MADGSRTSNSDFETAKAYLMQANEAGTTVYDHLTEVLGRLLDEKPSNAVDVLETVSYELKADKFSAGTAVRVSRPCHCTAGVEEKRRRKEKRSLGVAFFLFSLLLSVSLSFCLFLSVSY
jgi:hypothetical protein